VVYVGRILKEVPLPVLPMDILAVAEALVMVIPVVALFVLNPVCVYVLLD
jgi:hypothetical protein